MDRAVLLLLFLLLLMSVSSSKKLVVGRWLSVEDNNFNYYAHFLDFIF